MRNTSSEVMNPMSETDIPLKNLFDYLASGETLGTFLDDFEGVPREKVVKAFNMAFEHLLDGLAPG